MALEALVALGDHWALEDQPFYLENTRRGVTWGCEWAWICRKWEVGDGSLLDVGRDEEQPQDIAPLELLWRLQPSLAICWAD